MEIVIFILSLVLVSLGVLLSYMLEKRYFVLRWKWSSDLPSWILQLVSIGSDSWSEKPRLSSRRAETKRPLSYAVPFTHYEMSLMRWRLHRPEKIDLITIHGGASPIFAFNKMTPEEIVQQIIDRIDEGDTEVLNRISLVMKNRLLSKKEDLKEIEALLAMQVRK